MFLDASKGYVPMLKVKSMLSTARYQEVAMGGGQQEIAVTLLRAAAQVSIYTPQQFIQ